MKVRATQQTETGLLAGFDKGTNMTGAKMGKIARKQLNKASTVKQQVLLDLSYANEQQRRG